MSFRALIVSTDENAIAVLTPVLAGFGLSAGCSAYPDAPSKLKAETFDALIVDFDDPESAIRVLQGAGLPGPASTLTVALVSDKAKVRNVFGAGANFVLYKPLSTEHAEASLRAATALLKRERRRSLRVPVQVPVQLHVESGGHLEGILLDLSEDGLEILAAQPLCPSAQIAVNFTLPEQNLPIGSRVEVVWANPNGQSGVRFVELPESLRSTLREWVSSSAKIAAGDENSEALSQCKLTDLSLGGCYIETASPFPERSSVFLDVTADSIGVQLQGMVRVVYPECGMGIEFAWTTADHQKQITEIIEFLGSRPGIAPQLTVAPVASPTVTAELSEYKNAAEQYEDPLLDLLRTEAPLSQEEFLQRLHKQRGGMALLCL